MIEDDKAMIPETDPESGLTETAAAVEPETGDSEEEPDDDMEPDDMESDDEEKAVPMGAKAKFMAYYKGKKADVDPEDEEAFYGSLNADFEARDRDGAELAGYRTANEKILKAMDNNPEIADLFVSIVNDPSTDPIVYLIGEYGDLFEDAIKDPANLDKLVAARAKNAEARKSAQEREAEAAKNLTDSLSALDEAVKEAGIDKAKAVEIGQQFYQIMSDAVMDKVSKETWMMMIKALNHDADVAEAKAAGEVKGRNAKIGRMKLKSEFGNEGDGMPNIVGGRDVKPARPKLNIGGVLGNDRKSVWED